MKFLRLLPLVALALCSCANPTSNPADLPKFSPEAERVMAFLDSIYGQKTLSSTMANVSWNTAEADLIDSTFGKHPAIIGLDYIDIYTDLDTSANANRPYDDFSVPQSWWDAGGLVSVCWHWFVPKSPTSSERTFRPDTQFRVSNMLSDSTWENAIMLRDLDLVANRLSQFRDANIPVLWRPLHEAAGNTVIGGEPWFWWGNSGAESYVALWRYMHDYFRSKGLNNLIWIWSTETGIHGDSLACDSTWYPGDEYVDIIGRDSYHKDASQCLAEYDAIRKTFPSKTLALSECGDVASVTEQWVAGARWAWFMPWYQYNAQSLYWHEWANVDWWQDAVDSDLVLWRDDLPNFK